MRTFDNGIRKVINKLSYPMLLIQQYKQVHCTCIDFATNQPHSNCKRCLGTGHKIKIFDICGVRQSSEKTTVRGKGMGIGETATKHIYHILSNFKVDKDYIIVDRTEVDVVQRVMDKRSDNSAPIYHKCEAVPLKANKEKFLKNLALIVGGD